MSHPSAEVVRVSWRLSPSGTVAVCILAPLDEPPVIEVRALAESSAGLLRARRTIATPGLGLDSQLLPEDDGSLLVCHQAREGHVIESVSPDGTVARVATLMGQSVLLARVSRGILVLEGDGSRTQVHRLAPDGLDTVATVQGRALGAVSLDPDDSRIALNVMQDGAPSQAFALDTRDSSLSPLLSLRPWSEDQVLDHVGPANLLVVSSTAWGDARVGYARPGEQPLRFPEGLPSGAGVSYLGASADGQRLLLAVETGATTRLCLVDTTDDGRARVLVPELPPLVALGRGHLGERELVVPVSTADRPGTLVRADLADGAWSLDDEPAGEPVVSRVSTLAGAAGPIECVVVGDPAASPAVVVALHGGPLDAWRVGYDPLLAGLARAGVAVVAPNVRGSTGYGREHALAIKDHWGEPDLDDVLAVAGGLRAARWPGLPAPVVLGISYGAWLAVLASAADPAAWSGCVAVSPFVSGRRVADHGGPVAELVERLGGTEGPDLTTVVDRVGAPVLLMHGELDAVVPVGEAGALAAALDSARAGSRAQHEVVYERLPGCGHDVFGSPRRESVIARIADFCHTSSRGGSAVRTPTTAGRR